MSDPYGPPPGGDGQQPAAGTPTRAATANLLALATHRPVPPLTAMIVLDPEVARRGGLADGVGGAPLVRRATSRRRGGRG